MRRTLCYSAVLVIAVAFLGGCSTQMSRREMDYGTSYKLAKFNQVLEPAAEKNLDPVYGLDGQIAEKVMDRYGASFERPSQAPTYTFRVGTSAGQR
jgi:hypothetical protein